MKHAKNQVNAKKKPIPSKDQPRAKNVAGLVKNKIRKYQKLYVNKKVAELKHGKN